MNKDAIIDCLNCLKAESKALLLEYRTAGLFSRPKEFLNVIQPYKDPALTTFYTQIYDTKGPDALETFRKVVILETLLKNFDDMTSDRYPPCIQDGFKKSAIRIVKMCQDEYGWKSYIDDVFWKDLAIARQLIL